MVGRTKIYEDVDVDSAKDEWVKIACDLFGQPYDDRDDDGTPHRSIREIGRIMHLSEVKVKKLLIAGGYYSTKETRSVAKLQRRGLSIEEISRELELSIPKVKTLMSYKYGRLYGIGTNSAQRNKVYRERKKEAAVKKGVDKGSSRSDEHSGNVDNHTGSDEHNCSDDHTSCNEHTNSSSGDSHKGGKSNE